MPDGSVHSTTDTTPQACVTHAEEGEFVGIFQQLTKDWASVSDADVVADHRDAVLLATCAEFIALEQRLGETDGDAEPGTAAERRAHSRQRRIFKSQLALAKRLERLVPTTLAGHAARARCLVKWAPDLVTDKPPALGEIGDRLLYALLRDLTAGSAAA